MKTWVRFSFLLILAVVLAVLLRQHSGNVLIIAQPWRVELSLTLAVLLLIAAFIVLHLLLRCTGWLAQRPSRFRAWRGQRAQRQDRDALEQGWIGVLEGRTQEAEQQLSRLLTRTRVTNTKVLAALALARSQHQNGQFDHSNATLDSARQAAAAQPRLQQAVAVVRAELYLIQGQANQALALLQPVHEANPRGFNVLQLLLQVYHQLGDYPKVYEVARQLQRKGVLSPAQARPYLAQAAAQRLAAAQPDEFKSIWGDLKREERLWPEIALAAAQLQARADQHREAGKILEAALTQSLDPQLLNAYSQCPASEVSRRVAKAESWLKQSPDNPDLLAALGNLCLTGQLWGAGERYLQRSMALRNDVRIHALLGNLYDKLGRSDDAMTHWRLAAGVAGSVPELRFNTVLPAADTRADPASIDSVGSRRPDAAGMPVAASAAGYIHDEPDLSTPPVSVADTDLSGDEVYFDSAPIPGVDLTQTSDRADYHRPTTEQGGGSRAASPSQNTST